MADFNDDGNADVVTANYNDDTLTLLLGDGKGHFAQAPGNPILPESSVLAIATGDFNGDGNPDLVVGGGGQAELLLGDGEGGFVTGTDISPPHLSVPADTLAVGDFNGDGKLDLYTSGSGFSYIYLGDGKGDFSQPVYSAALQGNLASVAVGDFNGDGRLDLASVDAQSGSVSVQIGNGLGGLKAGIQLGYLGEALSAGDFKGNGTSDLLTFSSVNRSLTWYWTGAGPLGFNYAWSPVADIPTFVVTADFNGDGKLDWAGVNPDLGTVSVYLGDGTGAFSPAPGSPYPVGGTPFALAAGDFNNDGKMDLAIDTGTNVVLLLNGNAYANGPLPFVSAAVNAASNLSEALPVSSYATLYGSNLAASQGDSSVAVVMKDTSGKQVPATILYAGSSQVNILVPNGLALGAGSLTVSNTLGTSVPFPMIIGNVAPGLFTVDTAGKIPAAQVVTVAADGTQTFQSVATCAGGTCTLVPIVLNSADQTYLVLYGTGIRGRDSLGEVRVMFGGDPEPVSYAGPQGGYPGLDQVNVLIPSNLAGSKQVNVTLTIETNPYLTSNEVQVLLQ
ncbi:MAG TPA: FG-GAP-like repeat-containing protein [Bryobacteraceae bacterium]|nr:FG-GAP-like repeat-containing protein [Bryobacteraceae bacterium]